MRTYESFRIRWPLAALPTRALAAALLLLIAACGGNGSPTAPPAPTGEGELFFFDTGCSCENNPPPDAIYVDGKQAGLLPFAGSLSVDLAPGRHTWSDFSATDPNPNQVTIQAGQVTKVDIFTNDGCGDSCTDDMATATRH